MPETLALAGGDEAGRVSLDALYRHYRAPVQRYLQRLCGSADLAEELAQETFANACAGLLSFRGDSSVATWLFRIARNTYLNSLRRPRPARIETDELLTIPDLAPTVTRRAATTPASSATRSASPSPSFPSASAACCCCATPRVSATPRSPTCWSSACPPSR